jgi:hypothetical protein
MNKQKILEIINQAVVENGGDFDLTYDEQTERLFNYIVQSLDLPFNYYLREGDNDYWTQIEYHSERIGKTIIWDYDAGNYDDYDELADVILNIADAIEKFEAQLPVLKK